MPNDHTLASGQQGEERAHNYMCASTYSPYMYTDVHVSTTVASKSNE